MAQAKEAGDAAMEVDEATRTRIDALHEKLEQVPSGEQERAG